MGTGDLVDVMRQFPVAAVASVTVLAAVAGAFLSRRRPPAVARRPLLTANEMEFLERLEAALPEIRVHAQVSMGALLVPRVREGGGRRRRAMHRSIRARFDRKVVDFVLQRRDDGSVVALVELDDRTHDRRADARRDAMTARAGYRTIRWDSRRKPGRQAIRGAVLGEGLTR